MHGDEFVPRQTFPIYTSSECPSCAFGFHSTVRTQGTDLLSHLHPKTMQPVKRLQPETKAEARYSPSCPQSETDEWKL
jgi:hypothetical protein